MIYGILLIGLALVTSGLRGTTHQLGQQVQTDLLGSDGFLTWMGAILGIGALGYLPGMRDTARYLLVLLLVVVVVRNGGIWTQAQTALVQASKAGPAPAVALPSSGSSSGGGGTTPSIPGQSTSDSGSSGGDTFSELETGAEVAALFL